MSNLRPDISRDEFIRLINKAHLQSERSLREAADLCHIDHSYLSLILKGRRRASRELLTKIVLFAWNLDGYGLEEIL